MSNLGLGDLTFRIIGWAIAFLIAIAIMRATFSIGRIVRLLTVIAQELRASNILNDTDWKMRQNGINKEAADSLNAPAPKEYDAVGPGAAKI